MVRENIKAIVTLYRNQEETQGNTIPQREAVFINIP
jgi:hypothetical protein